MNGELIGVNIGIFDRPVDIHEMPSHLVSLDIMVEKIEDIVEAVNCLLKPINKSKSYLGTRSMNKIVVQSVEGYAHFILMHNEKLPKWKQTSPSIDGVHVHHELLRVIK
jgi:hypothetical protein